MTISAEMILDSVSQEGIRITTLRLRYPRFIHAEFMTHREFSRNASSSRAIPVKRMIEDLRRDPVVPSFWGSNKPGMQAGAEVTGGDLGVAESEWETARDQCIDAAEMMIKHNLHKQIANRILEPWSHINVLVTTTSWNNFFALRRHKDAQPEIKALADAIFDTLKESEPTLLKTGEWHLPFILPEERGQLDINRLRAISVARCARVSYMTQEGKTSTPEEDMVLFDRLLGAQPLHASPAEHQATPDTKTAHQSKYPHRTWRYPELFGNLKGWIQYRKTLQGEYVS